MTDAMAGLTGRLNGWATLWLARIAAFVLAALAVVTFCDVVGRYFFNSPFTFTVEVTELSMGLIVYFGIGLTTHRNEHISVDFVTLRLSQRQQAWLAVVTNLLALGFLCVMVWQVWLRAEVLLTKGDVTQIWGIPIWPVAFGMAVGSVFLLTGVFLQMVGAARRLMGQDQPPPSPSVSRPYTD
ncbi:MAG: TRAP transporter small permease subunit [Rhizobiales bacterium]|nr:TRAP transporter small permease subunit [Hyphomicrobiales bacterium]